MPLRKCLKTNSIAEIFFCVKKTRTREKFSKQIIYTEKFSAVVFHQDFTRYIYTYIAIYMLTNNCPKISPDPHSILKEFGMMKSSFNQKAFNSLHLSCISRNNFSQQFTHHWLSSTDQLDWRSQQLGHRGERSLKKRSCLS